MVGGVYCSLWCFDFSSTKENSRGFFSILFSYTQDKKNSVLKPKKIGVLYNYGTDENFIFDDPDYTYTTNTFKFQAFYNLGKWKNFDIELIVQPQIQFLRHKLINPSFVQPRYGDNYLELREIYIKEKSMNLYGLEFGIAVKKQLLSKLDIQFSASLGFSYIDTTTERLASGFTFIENFSLGFNYQTSTKTFVYVGSNFGHVSNLDFQFPNDGYNVLGIEVGFQYILD